MMKKSDGTEVQGEWKAGKMIQKLMTVNTNYKLV